jgi:hypothetical protein
VYEANPKTMNLGSDAKTTGAIPRAGHEKTPFENFEGLAAKLLKVPKEEVDEKRAEREKARKRG